MSSLTVTKGDVVLVDVPYLDATQSVRRPALVVSDSSQMLDVIIAGITSRIRAHSRPHTTSSIESIQIGAPPACGWYRQFAAIACLLLRQPAFSASWVASHQPRCWLLTSV